MISKRFDVVALGELLIDLTENGLSEQGNPILEANPGGAPCNVLAMLQRFGHKTAFIGKVGNDAFGKMLAKTIEEIGIDTEGLFFDEEIPTTLALVHTAADGDRSFSFYRKPGADVMLRADEIDSHIIEAANVFHFGTLSMTDFDVEEATIRAVSIAKENGLTISFDPNLRPPLWKDLNDAKEKMAFGMQNCDILKISDDEIEFFTGQKDIDAGIQMIRKQYDIKLVCATLGKDGSRAYYKDLVVDGRPFPQENTIETTGAGDTFMGSVLHYVVENGLDELDEEQLKEMLTIANAAAALITTKKGALRVMPTVSEIDKICE